MALFFSGGQLRVFSERAPKPVGPYTQALQWDGVVYCSGQLGMNPISGQLVEGGVREQAEQAFRNLQAVLEAAGSSLQKSLKVTVYLTDLSKFAEMNEVYEKHFTNYPARSCVGVKELPKGALVEVDVVAAK